VYQLHRGIHKYIEQFPNGHFCGKNYVFDVHQLIVANDDVLLTCHFCFTPHDVYITCYKLLLACEDCQEVREGKVYCSEECKQMGPKWNKALKTPGEDNSVLDPQSLIFLYFIKGYINKYVHIHTYQPMEFY
jgi:predicted sulfurtransferase